MNTDNPDISVIMCCYNEEKYIEKAINSIINQTFKNFELIIVDDNSSDNSVAIIKKLIENDKRIKLMLNEENLGAAYSRNLAINNSKSEIIAIHDADDFSFPERFFIEYDFLQKNLEIGIIGAGALYLNHSNGIKRVLMPENNAQILHLRYKMCPFINSTTMFKKKIFYKSVGMILDIKKHKIMIYGLEC